LGGGNVSLLEKARASRAGWHRNELDSLYSSFGFIIKHGSKHDKFYHPDHPELFTFVPRHATKLGEYNITNAIKIIEKLQKIEEASHG
jgi:hypothetical protein